MGEFIALSVSYREVLRMLLAAYAVGFVIPRTATGLNPRLGKFPASKGRKKEDVKPLVMVP